MGGELRNKVITCKLDSEHRSFVLTQFFIIAHSIKKGEAF
jgi:hypothetical protein